MSTNSSQQNSSSTFKARFRRVLSRKGGGDSQANDIPPPDPVAVVAPSSAECTDTPAPPSSCTTIDLSSPADRIDADVLKNTQPTESVVVSVVKNGLAILSVILSDLGLPGSAACKLVITAVDKYEEMQSNVEALDSLRKHCNHIAGVIDDALKDRQNSGLSKPMMAALRRFGSQIHAAVVPCEEEQKKHIFFKLLTCSEFAIRIQGIFDEVGRLIAAFVFEITLAGHFTLNEVLRSAENKALADNVQSLRPVGAAYNDNSALNKKRTACLTGTREALLEEIGHWAVAQNKEPVYLLTGHAQYFAEVSQSPEIGPSE